MELIDVLLADDDPLSRDFLKEALESLGARVLAVDDGVAAIKQINRQHFDLVLTDLRMPRKDGIEVIRAAKNKDDSAAAVLVTAHGTVEVAVAALREGADDVLVKPVDLDHLSLLLERLKKRNALIAENAYLRQNETRLGRLVSCSPAMQEIEALIDRVAKSPTTVLVTGESGTGKEVIAAEIHTRSGRQNGRYVKINCAAIPENLVESELFGHEAGAFTGAAKRNIGKFELADRGTLLLDEIAEIPIALQAKLLRVIEDGCVTRVGGMHAERFDVRLIAATNKNLEQEVRKGRFREDLYYRLNVIPIHIAPLRERPEDLIPLAEHFLALDAAIRGSVTLPLSKDARDMLLGYGWPGNARELRNLLQRAALLTGTDEITGELIGPWLGEGGLGEGGLGNGRDVATHEDSCADSQLSDRELIAGLVGKTLREVEDLLILETLAQSKGNRTKASALLGVSPRTLYNRMQQIQQSHIRLIN